MDSVPPFMWQTLVEQRRPLAANLRKGIGALRDKEEKEQSSAPSYGSTVTSAAALSI
jgi:hypothetical protein